MAAAKRLIVCADDFGLSPAVNEAVERAHREGILNTASLMVAAPAAADAVRRARAMPGLHVGLHLVVIEGPASLPPAEIPLLVDGAGQFPSDQLRLGVRYFFHPAVRRQLRREIAAQFAAFARTGLPLDHANAHKHMHLHPTIGRIMIEEGLRHGLPALRIPAEPPAVIAAAGTSATFAARAMAAGTHILRRQAQRAGLRVNDHVFGLAWSGHMTAARIAALAEHLPPGLSELYCHPATTCDPLLEALMPDYEHAAELAALIDPAVRSALIRAGVAFTTYTPNNPAPLSAGPA
jgi:hopanoid biosynthesis associated protein HpnK